MATRIALAAVTCAAPLLLLLGDAPFSQAWLVAGGLVCLAALAAGYELAFVTYAIASWCVAAGFLAGDRRLDSALSGHFADAAFLMSAAAVAAELVRAAIPKRRP